MKGKKATIAIRRRVGRKKSRVKIGLRAFLFFLLLALVIAAVAISLNQRIEDRLWRETAGHAG